MGSKPTKLTVNPVDDVPWGGFIILGGRLTDESEKIPLDRKEITLSSASAPIDWNVAPIPTRTANGGYFSVLVLTKKRLANSHAWGITLRFAGDEEWKESRGNEVNFRTLAHKTQLTLEDINDNIPAGQQITFTAFLMDIIANSPLANRDVHFNGNGVIPLDHNPNVPVPEYKTTVRTNLEGKAAFTGVAPNVIGNKSRIFSKLCLVIPIVLFIVFEFILVIPGNALLISSNNNYFGTTGNFAYGQQQPKNQMNSNNITNSLDIQSIPAKKVHVGDIDIAYKTFGKGEPFLLISPSTSVMDAWDPSILRELSSNHTLIIFDNRGVGNTTTGTKPFSIQQLANDTAGLLDALKIQK